MYCGCRDFSFVSDGSVLATDSGRLTEMPLVYRVKDWDTRFENYKSREVDSCGFVCVPNKQDGLGLNRILAETDGAAVYGIFSLIIGACSRQRRPRSGWLTDDGRESG